MHASRIAALSLLALTAPVLAQTQGLTYERWNNLPGTSLETLRTEGINTRTPDHIGTVALAKTPANVGNNYGARMRGLLTAPATGEYTFFVAGDDNVELWLAHDPDADTTAPWNRQLIAWHRRWSAHDQWTKFPTQRSKSIRLQAGESYSIEALVKESLQGDHLSVGWHITETEGPATTSFSATAASFEPQPSGNTDFSVVSGDILSDQDRGAFHHQPWSGDGVFTIELGGLNDPHAWAKAGLMLRESLSDHSRHAFLCVTPQNGTAFYIRNSTAGSAARLSPDNTTQWAFLRLERDGDTISSSVSADGVTWQAFETHTFTDLAESLHIGFAAGSHSNQLASPYTGWFTPVEARTDLTSDPVALPTADVGQIHWLPTAAEWTPQADGTLDFSVVSGDIWGSSDRGSFHAREWTGNGEFITYVGELESGHAWSKAGLMLRAHMGDSSRNINLVRTTSNGITFQCRANDGGNSSHTTVNTGETATHPWLRLVRQGNRVTASSSADGRIWGIRGSVTFNSLPATVLVGHSVSSHNSIPATGWFGPLEVRPLTATEVIPGAHLTTHQPHPEDPLDRGLPDAWMTANNLDPLEIFGDNGPFGDPDQDGLDNLTEYRLGTDPLDPAPAEGVLTREFWSGITGNTVQHLINHNQFYETPHEISLDPGVDFAVTTSGDLPFGARYRGKIVAPATGTYRFWITASGDAELWLADGSITPRGESSPRTDRFGKRRIAWIEDDRHTPTSKIRNFDLYPSQRSAAINLEAGQPYYIEVLHKKGPDLSHVTLAWQTPGVAIREIVPAEHFRSHMPSPEDLDDSNLPDAWQDANNFNDPALTPQQRGQYGDPDGDGLTNLQEYQFGTDPHDADTDGDGLSDYDEIFYYGTDPLVPNVISPVLAATPDLHQYTAYTGGWTHNSDGSLSAWDRRGEISYTFTITEDGIHEVIVTGAAIGDVRPVERLPIVLSLNGGPPFASKELLSEDGGQGTVRAITPILKAGDYTLTILHDNYRTARRLRLDSIEIFRLGGIDLNESGIPDWAEQNAAAVNALTRVPVESRTSPVSIEGTTQDLASTTVEGASGSFTLTPSINNTFFTDIPLDEEATTPFTATFLGGIIEETHDITWIATNLLEFHEGELHIRQDDALRLHAAVEGASGSYILQGSAGVPPAPTEPQPSDQPLTLTFDTPGTHTLTATWTPEEGPEETATVILHVHAANLGPAFSVRVHSPVDWSPPALDPLHFIEADDRISFVETTTDPGTDPRTFRVGVDAATNRYLIARLPHDVEGAPSAILTRGTAHGFYLATALETHDTQIITQMPDGTWLMTGSMVAINLPSDILIRLNSILQGTIFQNGEDTLWLDQSNFDNNGIVNIQFEWNGGGDDPRNCHRVFLFTQD